MITRHINNDIWKTTDSWRFWERRSTYVLIITWVDIMKSKWVKVRGKLPFGQESKPVLRRTFNQNISLINEFFFLSQTNLVFNFNLVLIEWFSPQFISLFTFWYVVYLGVLSSASTFFIRICKILMRLNVFSYLKVHGLKMFKFFQ